MTDLISRQAAIDEVINLWDDKPFENPAFSEIKDCIEALPSAQPQYEELTPEEAAPEIASGSILRASYWLDILIALKQMGYAICRKKG